jgi:Zn-dependent peptidase ImmA (M78 family)
MAIVRRQTNDAALVERAKVAGIKSADELRAYARSKGIRTNPLDVEKVALSLGLTIRREPMEDALSGYLQKEGKAWVIGINAYHHPRRQRFTLAHELAHFLLHSGDNSTFVDRTLFRNDDSHPMEWEANRFAGSLLIPDAEFRGLIAQGTNKVEDLADHFKVSALAVRVKAKILGIDGHGL